MDTYSEQLFAPSQELLVHHKDGRKPLRRNNDVYCPYSLDESPAICQYDHRSSTVGVDIVVDGVRKSLLKCCDSRLKSLKETDYVNINLK
jgi:hypothetical protein